MVKMEKETRLKLAIVLSLIFMCIEIAGGYMANSIAIFSDAAHLLTDIAGFIIALIATIAAQAPGTKHLTFGMARAEVFGALASVMSLWVITAFLLYAAFFRAWAWFENTAEPVDGFLMFVVACFGVLVNLCLGYVFHEDHGGAFHPGHSHEHGHSCGSHGHGGDDHGHSKKATESSKQVAMVDMEKASKAHEHGHEHNHTEKTPLLSGSQKSAQIEPFAFTKSTKCTGHGHDQGSHSYTEEAGVAGSAHGHDHGHSHGHGHDHSSHADHDHADRDIEASTSKGGAGHDHSHGHTGHADSHDDHSTIHGGHNHYSNDVNLEAAYLHVLTDLIQSIGVAIAGAVLWWKPHWQIIDPICTVLFSIVALRSTLPLINKVGMILFEGTPAHVRIFSFRFSFGTVKFSYHHFLHPTG